MDRSVNARADRWFGRIASVDGRNIPVITDLEVKRGRVLIFTGTKELWMEPYMMKGVTSRTDQQVVDALIETKMKNQ